MPRVRDSRSPGRAGQPGSVVQTRLLWAATLCRTNGSIGLNGAWSLESVRGFLEAPQDGAGAVAGSCHGNYFALPTSSIPNTRCCLARMDPCTVPTQPPPRVNSVITTASSPSAQPCGAGTQQGTGRGPDWALESWLEGGLTESARRILPPYVVFLCFSDRGHSSQFFSISPQMVTCRAGAGGSGENVQRLGQGPCLRDDGCGKR